MNAKERLQAYRKVLDHAAEMIHKRNDISFRRPQEDLLGGPDGKLDYDLLVAHEAVTKDLASGNANPVSSALEALLRFALSVTEGNLDVSAAKNAPASEPDAAPEAPALPQKPAGLGQATVA
jgi:hypothetical protein